MPYIKAEEIETLIEIENYLGDKESWSENTNKIWQVIDNLLERQKKERNRQKNIMRAKRAIDKNYGRKEKLCV